MTLGSKIFVPGRCLGYVSNHIPLQPVYVKSMQENLIITCVGKSFHTYGTKHFGLLNVSGLHSDDITSMAVDSYFIYTACGTTVHAWKHSTEVIHTYRAHKETVHLMVPFGNHLITVDSGSNLKVWIIKDESLFLELPFSNESFKISTAIHPATYINKILLGSEQGTLQLWNINSAKLIYNFEGWKEPITCLEQSSAIDIVAIGLQSGRIILHDIKKDITKMEFMQDYGNVTNISFRTDGQDIMAVGSVNGSVVFWDLNEQRVASQLTAHETAVTGLFFLPKEPLLVTSSPDNTLKMWIFDMTDGGARLLRIREGHSAPPNFIRFHGSKGNNILSAAGDSSLRVFNAMTERKNRSFGKASYNKKSSKRRKGGEHDPLIMPPIIQFTTETTREKEWNNIAAVHSESLVVSCWSYDKSKMGDLKLTPTRENKENLIGVSASSIHLSNCGNFVIVGYSDGFVDKYNMQSGMHRGSFGNPKAHVAPVRGVASNQLSTLLITGGGDCQIKFWSFKTLKIDPLSILNVEEPVNFFRMHQESSMLAVALENFSILVLDIDTRNIVRKFEGHRAQITDATFSPDSRWLVSAGMDCCIRTWDIPSARLIDQFKTDAACISLNFSPTGEVLATAHVDYLGIFLWGNRTLYTAVTLKALSFSDEPASMVLPQLTTATEKETMQFDDDDDNPPYITPQQINSELITLSGLPTSKWANLLNIDVIKRRNKPKEPPKTPKAAPFFLPTLQSLNMQFDLPQAENLNGQSKLIISKELLTLTDFGVLLKNSNNNNFDTIIHTLKNMSSAAIDKELQGLSPSYGGSLEVMINFFKCIEFMFNTNKDYELAEAYLALFLKHHGKEIACAPTLRTYLRTIENVRLRFNNLEQMYKEIMCLVERFKCM